MKTFVTISFYNKYTYLTSSFVSCLLFSYYLNSNHCWNYIQINFLCLFPLLHPIFCPIWLPFLFWLLHQLLFHMLFQLQYVQFNFLIIPIIWHPAFILSLCSASLTVIYVPFLFTTLYFSLYVSLLSVTHIPEHHTLHPFLLLLYLVLRPSRSLMSWWPSCWGTRPPSVLWWQWSQGAVSSTGPLACASHCLRPGGRVHEILVKVTLPASACSAVLLVCQDFSTVGSECLK